jgi:hypothetical protein
MKLSSRVMIGARKILFERVELLRNFACVAKTKKRSPTVWRKWYVDQSHGPTISSSRMILWIIDERVLCQSWTIAKIAFAE